MNQNCNTFCLIIGAYDIDLLMSGYRMVIYLLLLSSSLLLVVVFYPIHQNVKCESHSVTVFSMNP